MKKIKKSLLSVLLFSFSFLVLHDYAMAELSGLEMYEISTEKISTVGSEYSKFNAETQIHESIHNILALGLNNLYTPPLVTKLKPSEVEICIISHNSLVLERPPLV